MLDPSDRHDPDSPAEPAPDPLKLVADNERLRTAMRETDEFICQTLAQAIGGFRWYKDDPENFPEATEESGVCVGEHTSDSLALDAADRIRSQRAQIAELKAAAEPIKALVDALKSEPWPDEMTIGRVCDANCDWTFLTLGQGRRLARAVERVK